MRAHDSSNIFHHDDTRGRGGDSPATGLGEGSIYFRDTDTGLEFQFGPGDQYHECPLAIGRLEPLLAEPIHPLRSRTASHS